MKPFDRQIQALTGQIKHHLSYSYSNEENRARNAAELVKEYNAVSKFPTFEISSCVWDEMNDLAEQALLTNRD